MAATIAKSLPVTGEKFPSFFGEEKTRLGPEFFTVSIADDLVELLCKVGSTPLPHQALRFPLPTRANVIIDEK